METAPVSEAAPYVFTMVYPCLRVFTKRRFNMPNWCFNVLTVCGPAEDLTRFKQQAVGASPWSEPQSEQAREQLNFHSLVPIPAEVLAAGYQRAGYDWERTHWGCKWGACHATVADHRAGELVYSFDTAWSPPLPFLHQVSLTWPTLVFVLEYEEPMMGFEGLARVTAGTVEDHYIEF